MSEVKKTKKTKKAKKVAVESQTLGRSMSKAISAARKKGELGKSAEWMDLAPKKEKEKKKKRSKEKKEKKGKSKKLAADTLQLEAAAAEAAAKAAADENMWADVEIPEEDELVDWQVVYLEMDIIGEGKDTGPAEDASPRGSTTPRSVASSARSSVRGKRHKDKKASADDLRKELEKVKKELMEVQQANKELFRRMGKKDDQLKRMMEEYMEMSNTMEQQKQELLEKSAPTTALNKSLRAKTKELATAMREISRLSADKDMMYKELLAKKGGEESGGGEGGEGGGDDAALEAMRKYDFTNISRQALIKEVVMVHHSLADAMEKHVDGVVGSKLVRSMPTTKKRQFQKELTEMRSKLQESVDRSHFVVCTFLEEHEKLSLQLDLEKFAASVEGEKREKLIRDVAVADLVALEKVADESVKRPPALRTAKSVGAGLLSPAGSAPGTPSSPAGGGDGGDDDAAAAFEAAVGEQAAQGSATTQSDDEGDKPASPVVPMSRRTASMSNLKAAGKAKKAKGKVVVAEASALEGNVCEALTMEAAGENDKVKMGQKQHDTHFVIRVMPSRFKEKITVLLQRSIGIKFTFSHVVEQDGKRIKKGYARVLRLPYENVKVGDVQVKELSSGWEFSVRKPE